MTPNPTPTLALANGVTMRQLENLDSFGFTLSDQDMVALGSLDRPDPQMLDSDSFGH